MQNSILQGVREKLCRFVAWSFSWSTDKKASSEALPPVDPNMRSLLATFFDHHPPATVRYFNLLLFQAWAFLDTTAKTGVSDEQIAAYLDQLHVLIDAVHRYHRQLDEGPPLLQQGGSIA